MLSIRCITSDLYNSKLLQICLFSLECCIYVNQLPAQIVLLPTLGVQCGSSRLVVQAHNPEQQIKVVLSFLRLIKIKK